MKKLITRVTEVTFTVTSVNRASIQAKGEVPTSGWIDLQLEGPRLGDGILHFKFVAQPPDNIVPQIITQVSADHSVQLGPQPQDVTVHAETNEMSVRLPAADDPPRK